MKSVLVTASGLSPVGIDTILSLKNFYEIVCVDTKPIHESIASYFCRRYYEVPMASDEIHYIEKILSICKKEAVEVILPLTTEETLILFSKIDVFNKKGIRIANRNTIKNIKICSDKWLTNNFLREKDISIPDAVPVVSAEDVQNKVERFGYPKKQVVIKPRITHGSRGFKIITTRRGDLSLITELKPTDFHFVTLDFFCYATKGKKLDSVLMEYLEGDDYSVYTFCLHGKPLVVLPMKRTGLIPGMSTGGILEKNKKIIEYVTKIIGVFGFNGTINFQLKNTNLGCMVYEINARISATTVLGLGVGINFPFYEILLAEGKIEEIKKSINGTHITWGLKLHRVQREIYQQGKNFYEV